jgi:glycosyltransferase involved in cell wall biosynthesis
MGVLHRRPIGRPAVSVVLPVRNGARTLAAAVASLREQTLREIEIVIVDDGSTDGTPDLIRQLCEEDDRVGSFRTPGRGIAAALNAGLRRARGRYVARMDADDLSLPRRLELQSAFLDRHPATGLVACRVLFGGDRRKSAGYARYADWTNSLTTHEEISLHRFVESPFAHPSVMFRRNLSERFGGYRDGDFPEDYELWLRWLERGVRVEKLTEPLLVWNDPPERLSRTDPRYSPERFYEVKSGYLYRWLEAHNPFHPEICLIGAGRTTRRRARSLEALGVRIAAYVDIDPRKVGHFIQGRRVVHRDEIPPPASCFLLSYVGSRGAREEIRAFLEARAHRMGRDFLLAA